MCITTVKYVKSLYLQNLDKGLNESNHHVVKKDNSFQASTCSMPDP